MKNAPRLLALLLIPAFTAPLMAQPAPLPPADRNLVQAIPAFLKAPKARWAPLNNPEALEMLDPKYPEMGLRVLSVTKNSLQELRRLAQDGYIQSGDIALTVRPDWIGGGPYANIQMTISHAGLAYIAKDASGTRVVKNVENPLNKEYLLNPDRLGDPDSHYKTLKMIHIVRSKKIPNNSQAQTNVREWASLFNKYATNIYGNGLVFKRNYNDPEYPKDGLKFVHRLAQMALRIRPQKNVQTYCSEFAWAVQSLSGCRIATDAGQFALGAPEPAPCIQEIFMPKPAIGDATMAGLADGPLANVTSIANASDRMGLISQIFANGDASSKMSPGHVAMALDFNAKFAPVLKPYYEAFVGGNAASTAHIRDQVNGSPDARPNYSPTAFFIEAIAPEAQGATFEYVMSLVFRDS